MEHIHVSEVFCTQIKFSLLVAIGSPVAWIIFFGIAIVVSYFNDSFYDFLIEIIPVVLKIITLCVFHLLMSTIFFFISYHYEMKNDFIFRAIGGEVFLFLVLILSIVISGNLKNVMNAFEMEEIE